MDRQSPLQLAYAFHPSPNPIRASVPGGSPNTVALQVMVSNATGYAVTLDHIAIQIPVGEGIAADLSASPSLPAPEYDTATGWKISSSAGTVTLVPPGPVTGSVVFTLPGIAVNEAPGTVPLTITELPPPPGSKTVDYTSYALVKWPDDFPVTSFYAEPAALSDLNEPTTLYWTCNDEGSEYVYSLHSDDWQPRDCLGAGNCFQCGDGSAGVTSAPLAGSTDFALDVISTARGTREIVGTLTTRVPVTVPSISQNSYATQYLASGRVALLHWLAYDAAYCTVSVNGVVQDAQAPVDTYTGGYPLALNQPPGVYQVVLVAHAQTGGATATFTFPNLEVGKAPATVAIGYLPDSLAITSDSSTAYIANPYLNSVRNVCALDLATVTAGAVIPCTDTQSHIGIQSSGIAITPNGRQALVANSVERTVVVIDLVAGKCQPPTIPGAGGYAPIAISPLGKLVLVGTGSGVLPIDLGSLKPSGPGIALYGAPMALAFTADGATALAVSRDTSSVTLIDTATLTAGTPIEVPGGARSVAVTPDGSLALMAADNAGVVVLDLPGRSLEPAPIRAGSVPTWIALTPDGAVALVCNSGDSTISVVSVGGRMAARQAIPLPPGLYGPNLPSALAISPDGRFAVIVDQGGASVSVI